jgi:hypothetical protein
VAVDGAGDVLTSTNPAGVVSAWSVADVDGSNRMSGVSCPSVSLCIAVDAAGNVLSSSNPGGGPSAWSVVHVENFGLSRVSCPSVRLCVAVVDAGATVGSLAQAGDSGNVIVSSNPAGGAGAWSRVQADFFLGPGCGKDGPWDQCGNSLTGLSCPSLSFCVVVDEWGNVTSSTTPASDSASAWTAGANGGPPGGEYDGVSCASNALCVAICRVGGFSNECPGDRWDAGSVVVWNPTTYRAFPPHAVHGSTISTGPLTGVWCPSASSCFASDGRRLLVSTNPGGDASAWTVADHDAGSVSGLSCLPASLCVAVSIAGDVLVGSPPPTGAQIKALLLRQLTPDGRGAKLGQLLRNGGYSFSFNASTSGAIIISWYSASGRGASKPLLVATTGMRLVQARTASIKLKLTPYGRQLLTGATRLYLTAKGTFTPSGNPAVSVVRPIRLHR